MQRVAAAVLELEYTLIPHGLHVVGARRRRRAHRHAAGDGRIDGGSRAGPRRDRGDGRTARRPKPRSAGTARRSRSRALRELAQTDRLLAQDSELDGILRALDGRFMRPAPGGDLLRTPEVLPTGRNLHGFDPFRIPSAFAVRDGARQAAAAARRATWRTATPLPETIALVLWGTDNLKTEGGPIAPGARADRRRAALRQLRPARRRAR